MTKCTERATLLQLVRDYDATLERVFHQLAGLKGIEVEQATQAVYGDVKYSYGPLHTRARAVLDPESNMEAKP